MYITRLVARGLKLLEHVKLDFTRDGAPRMWTVLIGENGLCKTTLLQAVGMAASGYVRANQLADVSSLRDRRLPKSPATRIEASFCFAPSRDRTYPRPWTKPTSPAVEAELRIEAGRSVLEGRSRYVRHPGDGPGHEGQEQPVEDARASNMSGWFVAGYGTSRMLPRPGMAPKAEDPALGRLEPLFDRGRVIGTGFADMLEDDIARDYARVLRDAFVAGGLLPHAAGLELRGRHGVRSAADLVEGHRFALELGGVEVKIPAIWLSQGYQSTIAWVSDLVGYYTLDAGRVVPTEEMTGLVLIDELDLHLHPRWQVDLIPTLKRIFPKLQFIVTTHSPMVLPGLEQDEIVLLERDERGNVVTKQLDEAPALMTGSQIFASFFGIDRLYPHELGEKLRRFGFLAANPERSDDEERERLTLAADLSRAGVEPGWEPVPRRVGRSG